jgi:hypothetical protein
VNDWVSSVGPLIDVMAELETQIETIDSGKTIRAVGVVQVGSNTQAYLLTDA